MWRWLRPRQRRALLIVIAVLATTAVIVFSRHGSATQVREPAKTTRVAAALITPLDPADDQPTSPTNPARATPPSPSTRTDATTPASSVAPWPDGTPVRRHRHRAGARATALQYVSAVQSQAVYAGAPADRGLLADWLAPSAPAGELDRALEELAAAREVLTKGHGEVWWVVAPLAVRVVTATDERARVAVWLTRVIASGAHDGPGVVPAVSWTTSTVELVWTDDRGWSIESVSDLPGPVPMAQATAQPATSAEFTDRLAGFELVKEHS